MTNKQQSIDIMFSTNWKNIHVETLVDFLDIIVGVVPNSEYMYRRNFSGSESIIKEVQKGALEEVKKGNTVYTVTDDPDITHFLAFHKEFYPLVDIIKDDIYPNVEVDMLESFNPLDMEI